MKVNIIYNYQMIINDMTDYQLVKFLLNKEYMLQKDLSEKLNELTGKNTKPANFSAKLKREYLTFKDLKNICEVLGYNLLIEKKDK